MCVVYAYMHVRVHVPVCIHRDQRTSGVLFCHSLPYALETESLAEPGAMLASLHDAQVTHLQRLHLADYVGAWIGTQVLMIAQPKLSAPELSSQPLSFTL